MTRCYPISLVSDGLPCLVVGGGPVAQRKVTGLLQAGARVRVVATGVTAGLRELVRSGALELVEREAIPADMEGFRLVILATDDRRLNEALAKEAQQRGLLVNVVDMPDLCNFLVPATVHRGPVAISVSTGGAAPALAKYLRQQIEGVVGEEYGELATIMGELRSEATGRWATQPERAAAWDRLVHSEVLSLLRQGRADQARQAARTALGLDDPAEPAAR